MTAEIVLNKVRKLLALAGNNPNQQESEAAMMKAQQLLLSHGLEMRDAQFEEGRPEEAEERSTSNLNTQLTWWEGRIGVVVAKNFRCGCFRQSFFHPESKSYQRRMCFVGLPEDAEIAAQVYNLACRTAKYEVVKYLKEAKKATELVAMLRGEESDWSRSKSLRTRNDYLLGWIEGLKVAFAKNVTENALILVKPDAVIQYVKALRLKYRRASSIARRGDASAHAAGKRAGSQFNSREKLH